MTTDRARPPLDNDYDHLAEPSDAEIEEEIRNLTTRRLALIKQDDAFTRALLKAVEDGLEQVDVSPDQLAALAASLPALTQKAKEPKKERKPKKPRKRKKERKRKPVPRDTVQLELAL